MSAAPIDHELEPESVVGERVVGDEVDEGAALRGGNLVGDGGKVAAKPAQARGCRAERLEGSINCFTSSLDS